MTRMPEAEWRPIPSFTPGNVTRPPDGMVVHTAVSPATLDAFDGVIRYIGNPANQSSSYFVVGVDGRIAQCIDLDDEAWTQKAGNRAWVGVENIGDGTKTPLTDAQVTANAQLFAWLHKIYGVPLKLARTPSDRGLGYHAMGGVAWGNHPCPGAFVIAQLPLILTRAVLLVNGRTPNTGGNSMSRMVSHSNGGDALITLNGDGTLLIAQGCSPFEESDKAHVRLEPRLAGAQVFQPSSAVDEIVATVDGNGVLCRFANGHFAVARIAHGEVR